MDQSSAIVAYFDHLDEGRPSDAAGLFAEHALYIRPVIDAALVLTGELETIEGREAIERYFVERGTRPYRHSIRSVLTDGAREFVEGFVQSDAAGTAFLATAALDADGRITRYFSTAMAVSADGLAMLDRRALTG